jgi:hypothetical protein
VSKADAVHAGASGGPPYFSISARKLAVLLLCTGGAYSLVWLYHNWWAIRLRSGQKLSPIHRSLLFFVFLYPLLKGMRVSAEVVGVKAKFSPVAIAVSMPPILWLARLDDLLWPLVYVGVAPLVLVQLSVNRVNDVLAPGTCASAAYSAWERVIAFGGGPFVVLGLVGTYLLP